MLFDFGAEAGLWTLQAVSGSEEDALGRMFAKALPVADVDHGLHHAIGLRVSIGSH